MVTSPVLMMTLLTLAAIGHQTARAICVDESLFSWNNLVETTTESRTMKSAATATDALLIADESSGSVDITQYFTVSRNNGDVLLTPTSSLAGVADYPINARTIAGFCNVTCNVDITGQFSIRVTINDANTATPKFSAGSYSVDVMENYPMDLVISTLTINASDYDQDANNNVVTFSLDDDSTFSLTEAVQTSTSPATFTTQLMLTQSLDWSQQSEYRLTVTATDSGALKATSDVTITVIDMDNMPPAFQYSGYTAEALDTKAVGPLAVKPEAISASDPDLGGPLRYTLLDLPQAHWAQYFSLDPDNAELSLAKEIPVEVATPSEISLTVEVKETKGALFSTRAVLVVYLTPQPGEESSNVGYIVGLAVLGCLALVMAVVAAVLYRRGKRPAPPPTSNSHRDSDWESSPKKRADQPAQIRSSGLNSTSSREITRPSPSAPASPEAYENHGYSPEQPGTSDSYRLESERPSESAPFVTRPETQLYPTLVSETDHGRPISDSHVTSAPPFSAQDDDVSATSPPIGDEDAAPPPEEPRPDYAAKSVGFKDTVVCVTPVEAADVLQVDDDDDDDDDEHEDDEHAEEDEDGGRRDDEELAGVDVTKDEDEKDQQEGSDSDEDKEDDQL